jgi:hypothetical protein
MKDPDQAAWILTGANKKGNGHMRLSLLALSVALLSTFAATLIFCEQQFNTAAAEDNTPIGSDHEAGKSDEENANNDFDFENFDWEQFSQLFKNSEQSFGSGANMFDSVSDIEVDAAHKFPYNSEDDEGEALTAEEDRKAAQHAEI